MRFLSILEPIYYEFLSKFVPQKVTYNVEGECKKCAKCCRYMFCKGLGSEAEFAFVQFIYPAYRRFKIVGRDEFGNFVIRCSLIDKDNLCPVYNDRPSVCRKYPVRKISHKMILHKDCGFVVEPERKFKDFLE